MKDAFDQEIQLGSQVIHGWNSNGAVKFHRGQVVGFTEERVIVHHGDYMHNYKPTTLVVVEKL
jgi:hypothetical protein